MELKNLETLLTTNEREKLAVESKSSDILSLLAKDSNFHIREKVAANDNTSSVTLDMLSKDSNISVRMEVVYNRNTSIKTLKLLTKDSNVYVREAANKRLATYKRARAN